MELTNWNKIFDKDYYRLFQTKDESKKEVDFLIKKLKIKKNDFILDIGCGNGRHLFELYKRGYKNSTGIDLSKNFIKEALIINKENCDNSITFIKANFIKYHFKNKFNKAYSFFSGFGYYSDKENEKYITSVSQTLKKDAMFILDLFNYFYFIKNYQEKINVKKNNFSFTNINKFNLRQSINKSINIIENKKKKIKKEYEYTVRYYSAPEIIRILENNNFKIINIFGDYKGGKMMIDSKRMIFLAQKK